MPSLLRLAASAACGGALLLAASAARADVTCLDGHALVFIPSAALHVGSIATSAIGLGTSGARRGWYNAAIATVAVNYAASAAVIATDLGTTDCYGERVFAPSMVGEGVALAATTGLLVAVVLIEPRDAAAGALAPRLTAAVVPRGDGTLALLGGTF